jgi:type IV pilus biogenesis protein CpaD/CtpE
MTKRPMGRVLAAAALAALGGCASTATQDELAAVRTLAEQASAEAAEAKRLAVEAEREAAAAQLSAEQARSDAAAARAQSEATETKIERMFKKAMYK